MSEGANPRASLEECFAPHSHGCWLSESAPSADTDDEARTEAEAGTENEAETKAGVKNDAGIEVGDETEDVAEVDAQGEPEIELRLTDVKLYVEVIT